MIAGMIVMFTLETGALGVVAWFVWMRMGAYLRDNPEAVAALTTHLIVPLLGKKQ